jgi:hypothetical protein
MSERFAAWKVRKDEERQRNLADCGGGFRGRGGGGGGRGGRRGDRDEGFGGGGGRGSRRGGFGRDFM